MKKFFFALTIFLALSSAASAAPSNVNLVRVSDFNPQAFVDRMGYGVIYQNLRQEGTLVAFTHLTPRPEFSDSQNFPGMNVWGTVFGEDGAPMPDGEVRFFVDPDGFVFVVQVISAGDEKISGMVLLMVMEALGLNDREVSALLNTFLPTAEVWCANTQRRIIRQVTDTAGKNVLFFGAAN